jgi:hypothetical protein
VGELTDIRHVQLARILQLPRDTSPGAVQRAVTAMPQALAEGFFSEAVDSDDVTGAAAAMAYLEDRLAFFSEIIDTATADAVRTAFERHVSAWDE